VVFAARTPEGVSGLWIAPCDGQSQPRLVTRSGETQPFFGPDGDILFRMSDGVKNYLFDMNLDGSKRRKVLGDPIIGFDGVSPDRSLAVVNIPVNEVVTTAVFAVSLRDQSRTRICPAECLAKWSPDGSRFVVEPVLAGSVGKAVSIPVAKGESIPQLPSLGVRSLADAAALPGSTVVDLSASGLGAFITPGLSKDSFAFARTVSHRNLFRVSIP